jgi:serine/threonine protein kinase
MKKNKQHFSIKTVMTIGICITDLLTKLHDNGFIHNDLKPDNVMIGEFRYDLKEMNTIYLIDFGISNKYKDENGNHKRL